MPDRWRRVYCVVIHGINMTRDDDKGCGPKWSWARKGAGFGGGKGFGGPPWMRGGPESMGSARPGRMFGPGDLRLLLLALIADKPSHGYDLIRTIEAKFGRERLVLEDRDGDLAEHLLDVQLAVGGSDVGVVELRAAICRNTAQTGEIQRNCRIGIRSEV